ncbi:hypothetical protein GCM10010326_37310 [Streptomyces xanthochromogenes]|uniref:Uncharacterized protein n=1 Tax=Streptomyces xanthochromogenes TaxID=67384 RepID=A0ABQ3AAU9_9ACTN|nr:hypothetical protein GCM10010326_37310 [Streptomyces xanthochromogenes]
MRLAAVSDAVTRVSLRTGLDRVSTRTGLDRFRRRTRFDRVSSPTVLEPGIRRVPRCGDRPWPAGRSRRDIVAADTDGPEQSMERQMA